MIEYRCIYPIYFEVRRHLTNENVDYMAALYIDLLSRFGC
jgi:hypothetical protein